MKVAFLFVGIFGAAIVPAYADEIWTCTLAADYQSPAPLNFRMTKDHLIETAAGGTKTPYELILNNEYAVVGILPVNNLTVATPPAVGVISVVIDRHTRQFWISTVATGKWSPVNGVMNGKCING